MKKIIIIIMSLMLIFSLVACGDDGENSGVNLEDFDIAALMSGEGSTDIIWGKQDEETKQAIIAEGEKEGVDISFGSDGSMTVVDPDGTTIKQKPDGNWIIKGADGSEGQLGGKWPDNEFTRLVPKPNLEIFAANADEQSFGVVFANATIDQIRDYAAKVKAAGFNINEVVEDQEMMGMVIYSFTAENADGYTVEITSAAGTNAMTISK